MSYTVLFSPEAQDQLDALEDFIANAGSPVKPPFDKLRTGSAADPALCALIRPTCFLLVILANAGIQCL